MGAAVLVFETDKLLPALREACEAVERRNAINVLHNVLIEADGEGVTLTTSDLDIMVRRAVPLESSNGAARFTVNALRLLAVVGAFQSGSQTAIEFDAGAAVVKSGRARTRFAVIPADDFPVIANSEATASFAVRGLALNQAFGAVRHAISTEETRYYLNGIFLHVRDGTLRFAATDGYRLAQLVTPLPDGAAEVPDCIIPTKTVDIMRKAAEVRGDAPIEIAVSAGKIVFDVEGFTLTSKLIDGTFPQYEQTIPSDIKVQAIVDRDAAVQASGRVLVATSDKVRAALLRFAPETLSFTVRSADHGDAVDEAGCDFDAKQPFEIGFNLRFLRDALQALDVDTVRFGMTDAAGPTLLTSNPPGALSLVLMPMRA
ncbi:DNA polymerase III subunit beta [Sphingomonas koreensis]|uniref:Beta sliding clamp n=1 Tax=Sphingomonas koreensis TaxID=93064 RepID=A0A430G2E5_9SPHN|nr:DNA polymerase III subunit beta [Sphingomonas koreensis]RSY83142.1 DNA polymerase III subunit beta [Sphingomonas koreensis]